MSTVEAFQLGSEAGRTGSRVCEQIIGIVVEGPPLPASVLLDLGFWLRRMPPSPAHCYLSAMSIPVTRLASLVS